MRILLTGGAGFIGSNLVKALLQHEQVEVVRVFDNLMTGHFSNIMEFSDHPKFEFVLGDIRDFNATLEACQDMTIVSHQAALGSVPRSIKNPTRSNNINITGTLNVFTAAKETGINRIVHACSSSTYGDSKKLPKVEGEIGNPLSPYAVTKLVNELYATVFATTYDMQFIGLRYFNVFGPKQDPNGAYAAVIPLFIKKLLLNECITINGDGMHSRDFTFVKNVVQANIKALFTQDPKAWNQVYNVACGERTSLLSLYKEIKQVTGADVEPIFGPPRLGDVKHSLADISKAKRLLDYNPSMSLREGLVESVKWYENQIIEKV
ncbi:MAG: UDP-N-acetylglucosamine 4-epimerase [Ulvibacter sp.]|jgi:UDP-N-acetylglucosamine 4-epimerase